MMRTASIRLDVSAEQAVALHTLRSAYADARNRLVPIAREHRLWNRVGLHQRAYNGLREAHQSRNEQGHRQRGDRSGHTLSGS